ncbi:MAG: DUF4258 domain-containing protein [Pseudoramibacter sp.]
MLNILEFKKLNHLESIALTKHAKDRLFERNISIDDITAAINTGEIIKQYEDDKPLPSCLILGRDLVNNPIHIVASHDDHFIYLITAYHPDPERWNSDFKTRKEQG